MKNNVVIKSAVWYTVSNFLVKALGFITVPLLTRYLTQAEFGIYNNFISWMAVLTYVVSLSLEATIISAKKDFNSDLSNYAYSLMILSSMLALFWLIIVNSLSAFFVPLLQIDLVYINAIFIYLFFSPFVTIFQTWERFIYKYKINVLISVVIALGVVICTVCFIVVLTNNLSGAVFGRIIPTVLAGIALLIYMIKIGSKCKVKYWKYAVPIVLPYIPHLLSMTLLGTINKLFIMQYCGPEETALYSLAYTCGVMATTLITSLNGAFSPWLGDKLTSKEYSKIKSVSKGYLLIFSILALAISLFAPEALLLLGGEEYLIAINLIPPIAMTCILQFVYTMYVNIEQYEKKTKGMAVASVLAALLNMILDAVLIPWMGYAVAPYASVAAYVFLMIAHMFLVSRLKLLFVYKTSFIVFLVILSCLALGMMTFLYPFNLVRWLLVLLLLIFAGILFHRGRARFQ